MNIFFEKLNEGTKEELQLLTQVGNNRVVEPLKVVLEEIGGSS